MENVEVVGFDVVTTAKVATYRAPGAPISECGQCVVDELAQKLEMDPVELRQKNEAREHRAAYGQNGPIGCPELLSQAKILSVQYPAWP